MNFIPIAMRMIFKLESFFVFYGIFNIFEGKKMKTIITIKKNKPAYRALILLAKELEKNDNASISIKEEPGKRENLKLIMPKKESNNPFHYFDQLSDFPSLSNLRKKAWPKVS